MKHPKGKPTFVVGTAKREPRARTFTGCRTCRSRHLKCDEARPVCSSCQRLSLPCEGYAARLLWISSNENTDWEDKQSQRTRTSFRYPLLTEDARSCMSSQLVDSLGNQAAGDLVQDLDAELVAEGEHRSVGPFGVFRAFSGDPCPFSPPSPSSSSTRRRHPGPDAATALSGEDTIVALERPDQADSSVETLISGFSWQASSERQSPIAEQYLAAFQPTQFDPFSTDLAQLMDFVAPSFDDDLAQALSFDDFARGISLSPPASPTQPLPARSPSPRARPPPSPKQPQNPGFPQRSIRTDLIATIPRRVLPGAEGGHGGGASLLPAHTAPLLRYLKDRVLAEPPGQEGRKSPWKLLLLPCALETFAELSLWNTTSYTRRSILSILLAKSAFHLHKSAMNETDAAEWHRVAVAHQTDGQEHLKRALRSEMGGAAQAKYTEILMAILVAGVVSVYFDGPSTIKKLLLDAERLIRWRGLSSNRSFGIRILHHMYTHLRVMVESLNIAAVPGDCLGSSTQNSEATEAGEVADPVLAIQRFRLNVNKLGDLDWVREKPEEIGYSDIHLDFPGFWHGTMYPDIYGIPETLMTLLSQTISLVNEKPKLDAVAATNPAVSGALGRHIKLLEHQIWSWTLAGSKVSCGPAEPASLRGCSTENVATNERQTHLESMVLAMHQALIIYFYRRVYNVSAMMVQPQVKKTLELLKGCLDIVTHDQDFSIGFGWSAFIAACEATTADLQEAAIGCLETLDDRGIFLEAKKPSHTAKTVWAKRDQLGDFTFSWPDLMLQVH